MLSSPEFSKKILARSNEITLEFDKSNSGNDGTIIKGRYHSQPTAGGSQYNDYLGVASPFKMASIDKKIDDGAARTSKFQGYRAFGSIMRNCLTGVGSNYDLIETRDICMAEFVIDK